MRQIPMFPEYRSQPKIFKQKKWKLFLYIVILRYETAVGTIKSESYTPEHIAMAARIKAIGHPARLMILNLLREKGPLSNQMLVKHMNLAQSTVSKHLEELIDTGLVLSVRHGKHSMYHLHNIFLRNLRISINTFLINLQAPNSKL